MLTVKIMSEENLADHDTRKGFKLYQCDQCHFYRQPPKTEDGPKIPVVEIEYVDRSGETPVEMTRNIFLSGNAYVMNESGKTIASFAHT